MMKSNLSCDVIHCSSNAEHCCCRSEIHIGGTAARCSKDTRCDSFTGIPQGATNDVGYRHPNQQISITCDAVNCVYNEDRRCEAPSVSVTNCKACTCGETECATFKQR